mmetsp:Transcript_79672/g.125647  ORF Transcript_79672/g.125647 Transcript_79672/m.125647 type:complete len:207 (+) Transcript_79672:674-1294(+)
MGPVSVRALLAALSGCLFRAPWGVITPPELVRFKSPPAGIMEAEFILLISPPPPELPLGIILPEFVRTNGVGIFPEFVRMILPPAILVSPPPAPALALGVILPALPEFVRTKGVITFPEFVRTIFPPAILVSPPPPIYIPGDLAGVIALGGAPAGGLGLTCAFADVFITLPLGRSCNASRNSAPAVLPSSSSTMMQSSSSSSARPP